MTDKLTNNRPQFSDETKLLGVDFHLNRNPDAVLNPLSSDTKINKNTRRHYNKEPNNKKNNNSSPAQKTVGISRMTRNELQQRRNEINNKPQNAKSTKWCRQCIINDAQEGHAKCHNCHYFNTLYYNVIQNREQINETENIGGLIILRKGNTYETRLISSHQGQNYINDYDANVSLISVAKQQEIVSQINGTHGEATNTDDLATPWDWENQTMDTNNKKTNVVTKKDIVKNDSFSDSQQIAELNQLKGYNVMMLEIIQYQQSCEIKQKRIEEKIDNIMLKGCITKTQAYSLKLILLKTNFKEGSFNPYGNGQPWWAIPFAVLILIGRIFKGNNELWLPLLLGGLIIQQTVAITTFVAQGWCGGTSCSGMTDGPQLLNVGSCQTYVAGGSCGSTVYVQYTGTDLSSWSDSSCLAVSPTAECSSYVSGVCCALLDSVNASINFTATDTEAPTDSPTDSPTLEPTDSPTTAIPTTPPTIQPTTAPTPVTHVPTKNPTFSPTLTPTTAPTLHPTQAPTPAPTPGTVAPTKVPTNKPTIAPTVAPSACPTPSNVNILGIAQQTAPLWITFVNPNSQSIPVVGCNAQSDLNQFDSRLNEHEMGILLDYLLERSRYTLNNLLKTSRELNKDQHAYNGNMKGQKMTENDLTPIQLERYKKAQAKGIGTELTISEFFGFGDDNVKQNSKDDRKPPLARTVHKAEYKEAKDKFKIMYEKQHAHTRPNNSSERMKAESIIPIDNVDKEIKETAKQETNEQTTIELTKSIKKKSTHITDDKTLRLCKTYNMFNFLYLQGERLELMTNEEIHSIVTNVIEYDKENELKDMSDVKPKTRSKDSREDKRKRIQKEKDDFELEQSSSTQGSKQQESKNKSKNEQDKEDKRKHRTRTKERLNKILTNVDKIAHWIMTTEEDTISDELIAIITMRHLNNAEIPVEKNAIRSEKSSKIVEAMASRYMQGSIASKMISLFIIKGAKFEAMKRQFMIDERMEEDITINTACAWEEFQARARNALRHALNGNINAYVILKSKKKMNKAVRAYNGNTTNIQTAGDSTVKVEELTTLLPKTEVSPTYLGSTLPQPKQSLVESRWINLTKCNLGESMSAMSKEQRPITYDVAKWRGYTTSSGVDQSKIDILVGDYFTKVQKFNNETPDGTSSMVNRMSAMYYRKRSDDNTADSTQLLRVLGIVAQSFSKPRRTYIMSEELANIMATRARVRFNTVLSAGVLATNLLELGDIGPIQSDDWSTNYMKLFLLCYTLTPNIDHANSLALRGLLELLDSDFHVDQTTTDRVDVGYLDGLIQFNENCVDNDGDRIFPYITGGYKPMIAFVVNTDDVPQEQVVNIIACPPDVARGSNKLFNIWIRLIVLFHMPAPHGIFNWNIACEGGFQIRATPYSSSVSISGLQQPIIYVLLPIRASSINIPEDSDQANMIVMARPTFNGVEIEINVRNEIQEYPLLEFIDEFINDELSPTSIVSLISILANKTGTYGEVAEAKNQVQALVYRGASMALHQYGTAIPDAIAEPAFNSGQDCDISGATVFELDDIIPSSPKEVDYVFGLGTPLMWTLIMTNAFVPIERDKYFPIGWRKEESQYAQMMAQRFMMVTQLHHDILGLSIEAWEMSQVDINNSLLRTYMYNLWYGDGSTTNGINMGGASDTYESLASRWLDTGFPKDYFGNNIMAYRRVPNQFQEPYDGGFNIDTSRLKIAIFPDVWMDAWTADRVLEYCQPPTNQEKGVVISVIENFFPRGIVPTAVSTLVAPWDLSKPPYIGQDEWFSENNYERRANRRALCWLERHFAADGQTPTITTDITTAWGDGLPRYTGIGTNYNITPTRAASALMGRVDTPPDYAGKLDIWPIIDVTSWNWVIISGDLSPQNLAVGVPLATQQSTINVSRLVYINSAFTNSLPLPNPNGQKTNPLAALMKRTSSKTIEEADKEITKY